MMGLGKTTTWTEEEFIHGQTEEDTRGSTRVIKKMEWEHISGQTKENITEGGRTEDNTELGLTFLHLEQKEKENGLKEKEQNG